MEEKLKEKKNRKAVSASNNAIWITVIQITMSTNLPAIYLVTVSWISKGRTGGIIASAIASTIDQ